MDTTLDRGIPRVRIQETDVQFEDIKGKLFDDCKNKLGYSASDAVLPQRQKAYLMSVLRDVGIEPLSDRAVSTYQTWQEVKADKVLWRVLMHLSLIAGVIALIHYCVGKWPWEPHELYAVDGWFPFVFFGFLGTFIGAIASYAPGEYSEWETVALKGYKKPVPEFALSYALDISQKEPEVNFEVEELVKKERVPDPFLIATYGSAKAYIAVWDEPTFEGRTAK